VKFLGGLDILINNAGAMIARKTLADSDDDFWAETMSLNVGSVRRVSRAATPHLVAAAKAGGGASIVILPHSPHATAVVLARSPTRPRRARCSRSPAGLRRNSARRASASTRSRPA